jgi:hypothetical protein
MAVNYLFDTKYFARRGDAAPSGTAQNKYRVVIGDHTGTVSATSSEIVLFDPGIKIKWDGDQGRFSNAIMGSSLEFTARLDDAQLATWNSLLDLNEGSVFCLFFDNHSTNAKPWWWGHLMIESTSIRVENEHHTIDLTFSDGLAALRGAKWENSPGVFYTGFKKLSFYMREIQSKIPAFPGYKDYIDNVVSETYRPVFTHIGFPFPATESEGTEYRYDELDALFDHIRVRADTFNKPKKQVDRTRELEAAPDFFNAAEVLEDICKTFGATACVFNGFINLGGRLDSAFLKGIDVHKLNYYYDASGADTWQITSEYNSDTKLLNSQNFYEVKAGATMGRTLPIAQANLTHEEGGSDYLAADGYFLDSNISHLDYSDAYQYQQLHSASFGGTNFFPPDGMRQDLWYDFDYDNRNDPAVSTPFYTYPANRTGYLGFPARTLDELEVPSGEVMQLTFGGQVMLPSRSKLGAFINNSSHIGSVVVVRLRIQFKATNGTYYRLSRTVHTHALTGGTPDFINIDMQLWPFTSLGDKKFFRKLYNDVDWVPSTSPTAYADSWFEIIVPHGDSENSGEGYGATLHTLTQEYDGQVSYAPIGTKINGENDGAGVILKFSGEGEGTYNQYFRIDESFELPYGAGDATLSFEEFYFEMGVAQWDSNRGPRGNGNATGTWLGEQPTWHSAYADGSGGSQISSDKEKSPSYIHFTGLRVAIGDGSESSDFTTKMAGGDGYEIHNMGSSRLGSRKAFVQPHLNGTLWVKRKTADASGSFASPSVYDEKVRWFGHRGHDLSTMPSTLYDSLHGYVAEAFLQLFGESRVKYNMTLIPKNTGSSSGFGALINPFVVMETNGLIDDKDIDEYLMPLSYSWVMNEGVSGEFLKVGQARDISSIGPVFVPRPVKGPGGIVGLGTGVDLTKPVFQSKFVTDAITVDDETGDVTVIGVKTGATVFDADKISDGTTNKVFTATEQTKLTGIEQNATANQSNDFLKNRTNHQGTQTANTISNFASAVNAVTEVAASREVTDTITVTSGVITSISIDAGVLDVDSIEVTPNKTFVSSTEQALIIPTAQVANTASTNASNALTKTNLIQSDSGGVTGFTIEDNVTVLSTDQVTEDVGRTFKTATEQSKLDKIGFNTGNTIVYNLDTEAGKVTASKNVTDRVTTTGSGPSTKITGLTTTNGEFDVDDGRQKMGFLTSDSTGITQITVSALVDIDGEDVGNFFASSSGGTANRTGVTGDRVLLIDSSGQMDEVADGSAGQFLQTDGSGGLSFATASGGGGGWHGSTTLIKVLPTEWTGNDVGRTNVQIRIEDDTVNTLGAQIHTATGSMFAFNEIPTGYKATHVKVNASSTVTNGVEVLHYAIATGATTNSTTGDTNSTINITDMTSSATNALAIKVTPGATTVFIYSAEITIASV